MRRCVTGLVVTPPPSALWRGRLRQLQRRLWHSGGRTAVPLRAIKKAATPVPPSLPRAAFHPSVFLDAACASCCVVLLAASATRRSSVTSQQRATPVSPGNAPLALASSSAGPAKDTAVALPAERCLPATQPSPMALGLEEAALVACVLMLSLSNLVHKLTVGARNVANATSVSLEAAARLARLEAMTDKQLAEFNTAVRQIDKLQVRTRVTAGDIRRPIAQLQNANADQAAVLTRLATEQEALRGQLRDTQQLLAALQGLTAKQFQVTVDAIKQLRARQAAPG